MDEHAKWIWSKEEIQRVGYQVVDRIADYLTALPGRHVFEPCPREWIERCADPSPPQTGQDIDALIQQCMAQVAAYTYGYGHPRFFGWVNSPPTTVGVFAEALAAAMNPSCAGGNHAATYLEHQVVAWFKRLIGFPESDSMGILVSGGSMANLTGLTVARHVMLPGVRREGMQNRECRAVAYVSAEGHTCIRKSLELLGFGSENIRTIAVDERLRMRVDRLEEAIEHDRQAGDIPVVAAASGGTASTGTIDPLGEVREVCRRHGVWFHVDASYGGAAVLTGRYRDALAALRDADSLALDPHKWLYVPVEAGLALVRDGAAMRDAFALVPPYIRTDGNTDQVLGPPWFSEYGIQQTRGFRALKVWMALKFHGIQAYANSIDRDLALADRLAGRVREAEDLELVIEPSLSIVCFRAVPAALRGDRERLNAFNQRLLEAVQLGREAFVSSTLVNGVFCLRACIVNFRTTENDIDRLVDHVRRTAARLLEAPPPAGSTIA